MATDTVSKMRDFKGMKRSRSRNRRSGGGQGGGQNNNPNRSLDSAGPEGIKVRGNAQTVYERYQQLARDATSSGDRILAENYLQHAEHYFRLLRIMQPNRPVAEIAARDGMNQGFDIDFEDESGTQFAQTQHTQAEARDDNPGQSQGSGQNQNASQTQGAEPDNGSSDENPSGRRESRRERYERRRNERKSDDRNDGLSGDETPVDDDPLAVIEPKSVEPADDTHMPSFLTRPTPATGDKTDADDDAPPARKPRTRRPRTAATDDSES